MDQIPHSTVQSSLLPHYDVLVGGGGPAGVAAAIAAARSGASVLLIESKAALGGTVVHSSMPTFAPYGTPDKPMIGGIGLEILEKMRKITDLIPYYPQTEARPLYQWFPIDTEAFKVLLDRLVLDSGCHLLFHTRITGCETENGHIKAVNLLTPSETIRIPADVFIDCTGNGDLAAFAGCDFAFGDGNGEVQSGTLCFKLANFDSERFMRYSKETGDSGNLFAACSRAIADSAFLPNETKVSGIAFPSPGVALLNFGHVFNVNPLDALSRTRAEVEGRLQLEQMLTFLRKYVPGAEHAVIVASGPELGLRESRRVIGNYVLTKDDYLRRSDFEDAVAYYNYPVDIHQSRPDAPGAKENEDFYHAQRYKPGECYGIPYRALVPVNTDNLLTAGKIISCDRYMQGSVRVVPCCFATGEAAGTAASLIARERITADKLDTALLRRKLSENGCFLDKSAFGS